MTPTLHILPASPDPTTIDEFWREISMGNEEAYRFMAAWNGYIHAIDDLVDGENRPTPEDLCKVCLVACVLYSSNFYVKNLDMLYPLVSMITSAYLDSIEWEHGLPWQQQIADVLRTYGNEMILQVAEVVGGWPHRRALSLKIRALSYLAHHDEKGVAI